ncbi:Gfo/Idh/MocA family protein [Jeotgalibacillus proteolyticus]|uniref:Gfo/Idh/MocA family oxidoreductase n=1 Tax=Jeotgalibacillus proteolyticus TaxID=2082395 RepID=A0A2S5GBY2_9BACL|nr:Gfo/Idh/MocA family oxidoreductase [Jeotgalibacillus proteolyticus]PPA70520.1 gfo/Idh/MocA family oxidoreductase [Jeotgalibacillus proteolyticus]
MLRVLVVGAGTMGGVHARAYKSLHGVELAGIVDPRVEKAEALAVNSSAKVFSGFDEAAAKLKNLDVIDICLPTHLHKEYVLKSVQLTKNIICEKPLARSLEEAREMIEVCGKKSVRLFVAHVVRFFPEYKRIRSLLDKGKIGSPAVVRTTRGGAFPKAWENWYGDPSKSGGLILDLLLHDFDFLRSCFGEVKRVFAKTLKREEASKEMIDYALVTLRFQSGVIAHLEGTWAHQNFSYGIEIAGRDGIIEYDSKKISPLSYQPRNKKSGAGGVKVPESPLASSPYREELKHFIECIISGKEPLVTVLDAYRAMEIAMAAIISTENGLPVTLGGHSEKGG